MTRTVPSGKAQLPCIGIGPEVGELNHEAMAVCHNAGLVPHQFPTRWRIANNLYWRLRTAIEGRKICLCAADAGDSAVSAHPCRCQRTNIGYSVPWEAVQRAGWSYLCQWLLVVAHSKSPISDGGLDSRR